MKKFAHSSIILIFLLLVEKVDDDIADVIPEGLKCRIVIFIVN